MLYLRPTARGDLAICSMCESVTNADVSDFDLARLYLGAEVECPYCGE